MAGLTLPRSLRTRSSVIRILALLSLFTIYRLYFTSPSSGSLFSLSFGSSNAGSRYYSGVPIYPTENLTLPPLYPALKDRERRLPQHSDWLKFPEGRKGRYIRFGNQLWGVGLNNQMQEMLLNNYMAHESNRAYVFLPYIWSLDNVDYVPLDSDSHLVGTGYKVRPAKVPMSAYLNSPTVGTPWPAGDKAPRSVSVDWWEHACPGKDQVHLNTTAVNELIGVDNDRDEGSEIMRKWVKYLKELDARCVNILWGPPRIMNYELLGSDRIESLWADYSKSPVLTSFDWSSIVHSGVNRNMHLLAPAGSPLIRGQGFPGQSKLKAESGNKKGEEKDAVATGDDSEKWRQEVIPGLVSLHVRRGDFHHHCEWLSPWGEFNGWNKLSFLPDRWHPPWSTPTDPGQARTDYAFKRCWIEIDAIVKRLEDLRAQYEVADPSSSNGVKGGGLNTVFVSTNGDKEWIERLRIALKGSGSGADRGWRVVGSRDLELDWQQAGVDMAIDMEIASRAEIFVGNGFSSMSSTVTRLRLVRQIPALYTRFW